MFHNLAQTNCNPQIPPKKIEIGVSANPQIPILLKPDNGHETARVGPKELKPKIQAISFLVLASLLTVCVNSIFMKLTSRLKPLSLLCFCKAKEQKVSIFHQNKEIPKNSFGTQFLSEKKTCLHNCLLTGLNHTKRY